MTRYAERTEVASDRSRTEIERTLQRYGATAFAYGWTGHQAAITFEMSGRRIRFLLPLPSRADPAFTRTTTGRERTAAAADREYEQAVRQRWRALALVIKAKLEAVAAGITTLQDEFLAHTVLPDGSTVGDWARPQVALAYERSVMPSLMPGAAR